jgi:predicted ABC-type ATPase
MVLKPKLIIIAGPNGSGKTSLTTQILKHEWIENCVYINPDNIAQEKFNGWNYLESILKAAQYATNLRNECLKKRESLIF